MEHVERTSPIPPEYRIHDDGTWVQITFTLDPERYQIFWERAEAERRTLSCLAREAVIRFLKGTSIPHTLRKASAAQNFEDRP